MFIDAPALITILWFVFLAFWLITSFSAKKSIQPHPWKQGGLVRLVILLVVIAILQIHSVRDFLKFHTYTASPALATTGVILCALGIAFAFWARINIGKNWGMPMALKEDRELVTSGPYAYVRHPIYSGSLLAFVGSSLVLGLVWAIVFLAVTIYFIYSALREEKIMTAEFPEQYPAYKARTKMLIPFVF